MRIRLVSRVASMDAYPRGQLHNKRLHTRMFSSQWTRTLFTQVSCWENSTLPFIDGCPCRVCIYWGLYSYYGVGLGCASAHFVHTFYTILAWPAQLLDPNHQVYLDDFLSSYPCMCTFCVSQSLCDVCSNNTKLCVNFCVINSNISGWDMGGLLPLQEIDRRPPKHSCGQVLRLVRTGLDSNVQVDVVSVLRHKTHPSLQSIKTQFLIAVAD